MIELNKIHKGHTLSVLKLIDDESIDCVITSPPYFGLRKYDCEPQIWLNGKESCENHEWITEETHRPNSSGGKLSEDNPFAKKLAIKGSENFQQFTEYNNRVTKSDFCKNCNAWKGELGLEPTFELYLTHLWQIFDEIYRVLKKTGTCWVNLGDSYASQGGGQVEQTIRTDGDIVNSHQLGKNGSGTTRKPPANIQAKSLLQIPSRFSIGMTDRGWILRNKIIWHKPSCMPSSAKDRLTVDYEEVFFFVKNQKYYFEQMLEPANYDGRKDTMFKGSGKYNNEEIDPNSGVNTFAKDGHERWKEVNGLKVRNGRCVWSITSEPLAEAHFATFPQALIGPMIKAGCPEFICDKCGKAREKTYDTKFIPQQDVSIHKNIKGSNKGLDDSNNWNDFPRGNNEQEFIGYSDCKCNSGFHPGIVLDPFIGSGTTGIVARKLNRNYIGIELQEKYIAIAERRILSELGLFV